MSTDTDPTGFFANPFRHLHPVVRAGFAFGAAGACITGGLACLYIGLGLGRTILTGQGLFNLAFAFVYNAIPGAFLGFGAGAVYRGCHWFYVRVLQSRG